MQKVEKLSYISVEDKFKTLKIILKYVLLFGVFFVFSKAKIPYTNLMPFACALFYISLWCNTNLWATTFVFSLGFGLGNFNIPMLYVLICVVVVAITTYYIHKKIGKGYNALFISLYLGLSMMPILFVNGVNFKNICFGLLAISLSVCLFLCGYVFCGATIKRGFSFKLNLDEIVCGVILLVVFSMGLSYCNIYLIETIKIVATFLILLFCYIYKDFSCMLIAIVLGLGHAICFSSVTYIACFALYSLIVLGFKSNKYLAMLGVIVVEILLNFYFDIYNTNHLFGIISVLIGCILFLILPKHITTKINDLLGGYKEKLAVRNVVNRSKQGIKSRMIEVANVFLEMDSVYRSMVKGAIPINEAKELLKEELIEKCCANCPEKNTCLRKNGKLTAEVFDGLINAGFERGKATLLDVPPYLTSKCGRVNNIITSINQLLLSYKHYATMVNNMDASRILVAEQLSGVSTIMRGLAEELDTNISFDISRENRIIEELSYKNMMCLEALVYEKNANELIVTLLIKTFNLNEKVLEKIVGKVCGCKMGISNTEVSGVAGCVVLTLKSVSRCDMVFGYASTVKEGSSESGDSHTLIKIADGKYMVALCDGMGSGSVAKKKSSIAISLIENFYKAGFDNETILNSVNKLLSLNNEETFSAVDVCILDLNSNICDFIKLGATFGFVKRGHETIVIESSGLPLGVLEEMKPHITKSLVQANDIIVLVSDGITDAFKEKEEIVNYINNLDFVNPKTIADDILKEAVERNLDTPKDDMSVIVVRVFNRV